jgi:hypothetical protein
MGVRRERPPAEQGHNSVAVRLPDGTTKALPIAGLRGPVTAGLCCFCGQSVEHSDPEWIRLAVDWLEGGEKRTESCDAHRACLVERLHESINAGLFFNA